MNKLLDLVREYLRGRSPRERWLLVLAGCVIAFFAVQTTVLTRLEESARRAETQAEKLEAERMRAIRLAADVSSIRGGLDAVQARIKPGEKTNLLALLETMATASSIGKDQLESIQPKQATRNRSYPETGFEVRLKSVSLEQTTRFLHQIEASEAHLIIRSLGIRARQDTNQTQVLDVKLSVSSFETA